MLDKCLLPSIFKNLKGHNEIWKVVEYSLVEHIGYLIRFIKCDTYVFLSKIEHLIKSSFPKRNNAKLVSPNSINNLVEIVCNPVHRSDILS